jgi:hypothetical protein
MFKNKLIWGTVLIIFLILGVINVVNYLDISPPSKKILKKLPNEKFIQVVK